MITDILIVVLVFAWFFLLGYLAIRIFEKEFSRQGAKRESNYFSHKL